MLILDQVRLNKGQVCPAGKERKNKWVGVFVLQEHNTGEQVPGFLSNFKVSIQICFLRKKIERNRALKYQIKDNVGKINLQSNNFTLQYLTAANQDKKKYGRLILCFVLSLYPWFKSNKFTESNGQSSVKDWYLDLFKSGRLG